MSKATKHSVGSRKMASKATPKHLFPSISPLKKDKFITGKNLDEKYVWDDSAREKYYNVNIISLILANKRMGLTDTQSFTAAGLIPGVHQKWSAKLADKNCPPALLNLFKQLRAIEAELEDNIIKVITDEIVNKKNWVAALKFLELRWKHRTTFADRFEKENAALANGPVNIPIIDTNKLSDAQKQASSDILKTGRLEKHDPALKLIVKMPDNGRK